MKKMLCALVVLGIAAVVTATAPSAGAADDCCKKERVFELRTYITNPGKLPDLNKRFREHTCKLFEKHGIELIGFWTPASGPEAKNTLIYIVAFPSVEAQKKAWKAFASDPDWKKAFAESHKNGVIVKEKGGVISQNLTPTDYSPIR